MIEHRMVIRPLDEMAAEGDPSLVFVHLPHDVAFLVRAASGEVVAGTESFWVNWARMDCIVSYARGRGDAARIEHFYHPVVVVPSADYEIRRGPALATRRQGAARAGVAGSFAARLRGRLHHDARPTSRAARAGTSSNDRSTAPVEWSASGAGPPEMAWRL